MSHHNFGAKENSPKKLCHVMCR